MIFCSLHDCRTREDALASYYGAVRVFRVQGGWLVFFDVDDFRQWKLKKK